MRHLPAVVPKFGSKGSVRVGSVVMIRRDNVPRMRWPMATVEKLHAGKDGVVRSVDVCTSGGLRSCPVQRLHNLEVADDCVAPDESAVEGDSRETVRTRSGRVSRAPIRFS